MNHFYFQKGPVITKENWVFPTKEKIDIFLLQYIPEFKRIFNNDNRYELYFHGSCRDRLYGYNKDYIGEPSFDADFIITSEADNPDMEKVFEALCTAVQIGFNNKILVDIHFKKKPHYIDSNDFQSYLVNDTDSTIYKLNPTIKRFGSFKYEHYIDNKKDYLVPVKSKHAQKLLNKLSTGWVYLKPTKII